MINQVQKEILDKFESRGGVVDFFILSPEDGLPEYELHKASALKGLELAQAEVDNYFVDLISQEKYKNRKRDEFFKVTIEEGKLEGKRVSLKEFVGFRFDFESNRLLVKGSSSEFLNSFFWAGEDEITENIVDSRDLESVVPPGLSSAFAEPPYNLSGSAKDINKLFIEIKDNLFDGFDEKATIYSWSTNCSTYFDAGHEWWGAYFYTYQATLSKNIVVVLASSTD